MKSFHKVSGKINSKGEFSYRNIQTLIEWFSQNKEKNILVTFRLDDESLSKKYLFRYKYHILPQVQQAFNESGEHLTLDQVESKLQQISPLLQEHSYVNGKIYTSYKDVDNLTNQEMYHFIEHVIRICAENLNFIINE